MLKYKKCKLIYNKHNGESFDLFDSENNPIILNTAYCLNPKLINKLSLLYPDYCSYEIDLYVKYRCIYWNLDTDKEQHYFGFEFDDSCTNIERRWILCSSDGVLFCSTFDPDKEKDVITFTKEELKTLLEHNKEC